MICGKSKLASGLVLNLMTNRQGSINQNNLTVIEPKQNCNIHNRVKAALVNIQSLKSKGNDLITYLVMLNWIFAY